MQFYFLGIYVDEDADLSIDINGDTETNADGWVYRYGCIYLDPYIDIVSEDVKIGKDI